MTQFYDISIGFVCQLPQIIELKFDMGNHYNTDYNNLPMDHFNEES